MEGMISALAPPQPRSRGRRGGRGRGRGHRSRSPPRAPLNQTQGIAVSGDGAAAAARHRDGNIMSNRRRQHSRQQRRLDREANLLEELESLRRENSSLRLEVAGLREELSETSRKVGVIWDAYNRMEKEQSSPQINHLPPGPPESTATAPSAASARLTNLLQFSPALPGSDDLLLETGVESSMDSSI